MKFSKCNFLTIVIVAICVIVFCITGYFWRDQNKNTHYFPDMEYRDLPNHIVQLPNISESIQGEDLISCDDFEGLIAYDCSASSAEEIKAYFANELWDKYKGTHYTFPNDSYEIFVHEARYMPILRALGHNWMHYEGNLYEEINGKEMAKDKPNFRNYFKFTIRKKDTLYTFTVFCNTDDAEIALAESIRYLNSRIYY